MKILCAPDKFKGSLTAYEAAKSMAAGIRRVNPAIIVDTRPVADGGEGTIDIIKRALPDNAVSSFTNEVAGPLGCEYPVSAEWVVIDDKSVANNSCRSTAVIELASAAGLAQVKKSKRDPMRTTTFGVGELIARALDHGAPTIMIALGGSATCDGGCGLAQALGVHFTLSTGETLGPTTRAITGREISLIKKADTTKIKCEIKDRRIVALCDVGNPLLGHEGAARVYAPQKGADDEAVAQLEHGLTHLAREILPDQNANAIGAGAAGGTAFGLRAWCRVEMQNGFDTIMNIINFDDHMKKYDLICTGEGRLDRQSTYGKAMIGVARHARQFNIPVLAIVGSVEQSFISDETKFIGDKFTDWKALTMLEGVHNREDAISRARELVANAAEIMLRQFLHRHG